MKRPIASALTLGALLALAGAYANAGHQHPTATYDVTITNLTPGVSFTPMLVASHTNAPNLFFELGEAPSAELAAVAEGGDTGPFAALLATDPRVQAMENTGGLLGPGESVTVSIEVVPVRGHISLIGMLLPTNDGVISVQNIHVPLGRQTAMTLVSGYDGGSEPNDELCAHIPGPHCGGEGRSEGDGDTDEGFVHIHSGIHGVGDLTAADYDWNNPIAKVMVVRTR